MSTKESASQKFLRDPAQGLTNPSYERMSRTAGAKSLSSDVFNFLRNLTEEILNSILKDAVVYMKYRRAKTLSENDVLLAIQNQLYQPHMSYSDSLSKNVKKC